MCMPHTFLSALDPARKADVSPRRRKFRPPAAWHGVAACDRPCPAISISRHLHVSAVPRRASAKRSPWAHTTVTDFVRFLPMIACRGLLDGDRLCEVAWLVDVTAAHVRDMVREELQRYDCEQRHEELFRHNQRHSEALRGTQRHSEALRGTHLPAKARGTPRPRAS